MLECACKMKEWTHGAVAVAKADTGAVGVECDVHAVDEIESTIKEIH